MPTDGSITLYGTTIDGKACAIWRDVYKACETFRRFKIEISDRDSETTSIQQMAYWHAKPIKLYADYAGLSLWKAEQYLKRECGEHFFMHEVKENEKRRGQNMFECLNPNCRNLFVIPKKNSAGLYICPQCYDERICLFFMLSKTELSIADFNHVLESAWDFMESINCHCPKPDPEWRKEKETAK
jgi:hypothetical protein